MKEGEICRRAPHLLCIVDIGLGMEDALLGYAAGKLTAYYFLLPIQPKQWVSNERNIDNPNDTRP